MTRGTHHRWSHCNRIPRICRCAVSDCNPVVEGMSSLISTLNETNNFDVFVRTMRTKFRDL